MPQSRNYSATGQNLTKKNYIHKQQLYSSHNTYNLKVFLHLKLQPLLKTKSINSVTVL